MKREIHPWANLIPPMSASEFADLRASIRTEGLRVPITLHSDGRILDGRHRDRACRELDIVPRTETFVGNDRECLAYVLDLNLRRRHLDESQRAMIAAKLAALPRGSNQHASIEAPSQEQAAKMLKVGRASVQRAKTVYAKAVPELVQRVEQGEVAVSVAAKVAELPESEQRRLAHASEGLLKKQSARAYSRRLARAAEPIPSGMEYRIGDCREVLTDIAPDSVALILTDPPYQDEADPLFEWLAEWSARVLVPGGSLICFPGTIAVLRRAAMFERHLSYWWMMAMMHTQPQRLYGRAVLVGHKPVLWFTKGDRRSRSLVPDTLYSKARDKDLHAWGQGDGGIRPVLEHLTELHELVVDPFAGSGVWGDIAHSLGRRWIGCDLVKGGSTISHPEAVAA